MPPEQTPPHSPQSRPSANGFGGQAAELPVQNAGSRHGFDDSLHIVVLGARRSAGHAADVPSHTSSRSQGAVAERHTVPAPRRASGVQSTEAPSQ